jgi:ferredoxin
MAFVVCEPCRDCKYTDCVCVCPCECFYEDGQMLYIDPDACIDCEACVPECPVEAIFHENNITEKQTPKEGPGCRRSALTPPPPCG